MKKSGFTLIELLIVMAIIGILASVLVPNLLSARRIAQIRAEQIYTQNVYKAANAYLAENVTASTLPNTNCAGSYTVGSYGAGAAPSTLTSCTVIVTDGRASVSYSGLTSGNIQ